VRAKLADVTGIIQVAVVVVVRERSERGSGSGIPDRHGEHEEQDDRKNPSNDPIHACMIARGRARGRTMRRPRRRARSRARAGSSE
jgi:hypothetical protein